MQNLKRSASGPDDLPYWFWKEFALKLAPTIRNIFNSLSKFSKVPKTWKHANVLPVPKESILGADHLIFEGGGGGWKISKNNFLQSKEKEEKNHAAYNREKKYHAKESAQKKFLHVNLLTFFTSVLCPQACTILHFLAGTFA